MDMLKKTGIVFLTISILFVGIYLYLLLYIVVKSQNGVTKPDRLKPADVILVLGAKSYQNGHYNPCLVARVKHAVALYKSHYATKLLFSGGIDIEDNSNEAETMTKIAISLGVPNSDILREPASSSTYENLLFSKKILEDKQLKSIILVTEPFHSPRAMLVAKKLGLNVVSSPAVNSICWKKNKFLSLYFLKEPLAIAVYKIQNKL